MQRRDWLAITLGCALGACVALGWLLQSSRHSRSAAPASSAMPRPELLPEADGELTHVLLHWTPETDAMTAVAYREFLATLPESVAVTFVLPQGLTPVAEQALTRRLLLIEPSGALQRRARRERVVGPITTWSKDRALVSHVRHGWALLIAPSEPGRQWASRHNDWDTIRQLGQIPGFGFASEVAPFDFDAGDLAVAGHRILVDGNLLEKNQHRGYRDMPQLLARLEEYFAMPAVALGSVAGETPRHHLSMFLTPLIGRVMLVGDPRAARAIVGADFRPGELGLESQLPLVADFSEATLARFDHAAENAKRAGFEVVRIPNVPFEDKTYWSYTNGIYEVRGGKRRAWVPQFDHPALDAQARDTYARLGWETIPVHVRSLYSSHGTIGCIVNVLGRR